MRKNGSRLISLRQYRLTDSLIFAAILAAFEIIIHYAFVALKGEFMFSPMLAIVLLVMMRWGWQSVFYAVGDGLLFCLLNMNSQAFRPELFAIYIIGNAFIMLLLLATKFMGKQKIAGKWYFSALFVVLGFLAVVAGRTIVALCFGYGFVPTVLEQLSDLISLAAAILVILTMRRLDGMFEDQKHYLLRKDAERKELARRDEFGDEPIEIDEETLSILDKSYDELD